MEVEYEMFILIIVVINLRRILKFEGEKIC